MMDKLFYKLKVKYLIDSDDDEILIGFYRRHGDAQSPVEQFLGYVRVNLKPLGFSDAIMVAVRGFDGDQEYRIPCEPTPAEAGDVRRDAETAGDHPPCTANTPRHDSHGS
jgi:hypothetical protein